MGIYSSHTMVLSNQNDKSINVILASIQLAPNDLKKAGILTRIVVSENLCTIKINTKKKIEKKIETKTWQRKSIG